MSQAILSRERMEKADADFGIVHLVSGRTAKGEDFYAYISVRPSVYDYFLAIMASGEAMDLGDFGEIIGKGFGKEPTSEAIQKMEADYGPVMLNIMKTSKA